MPAIALQQLYIGGARVDATGGESFETVNPATGAVLAQVQSATLMRPTRALVPKQYFVCQ